MSQIGAIDLLSNPVNTNITGKKTESSTDSIFGDIFSNAIQSVKDTDAEKTQAEYLLSTGQLDNPATLTIASAKAELSVELLVNLRNKAVEAYDELMRISV